MALPSLKAFAFLSKAPAAPRHETANSLKPTNHMRPDRRRRLLSRRPWPNQAASSLMEAIRWDNAIRLFERYNRES